MRWFYIVIGLTYSTNLTLFASIILEKIEIKIYVADISENGAEFRHI